MEPVEQVADDDGGGVVDVVEEVDVVPVQSFDNCYKRRYFDHGNIDNLLDSSDCYNDHSNGCTVARTDCMDHTFVWIS